MRAKDRFDYLIRNFDFHTVVDWGCGRPPAHREMFIEAGKAWHGICLEMVFGDPVNYPADCLWSCHSFEHVLDPHSTLLEWRDRYLKPGGILCVTVPGYEHWTKSGHVNSFHAGQLLYRCVLAGFECTQARVKTARDEIGRDNITVIVRKPMTPIVLPNLAMDAGDLEALAHLFPKGMAFQGFEGETTWNW